jgi:mannose-6-phosphate isomerase-like protein (cupin superfamily)
MKVNRDIIGGNVTKDNETYKLIDNNSLDHLTLSKTILKPKKSTNGHSHDNLEEVYFFLKGRGKMQLGEDIFEVKADDIILIPQGKFHKVYNDMHFPMEFICVFEKYDRESDVAKYQTTTGRSEENYTYDKNFEDQNEIPFGD